MKSAKTRALNKKHAGTTKHTTAAKHKPTAAKSTAKAHKQKASSVAKGSAAAKARSLSLGEGVACCSAEALAASLRLAGAPVSDDDVLELHWRAGGDEDEGVSILAALEAAAEFGLAGYRPAQIKVPGPELTFGVPGCKFPCILGLELPGPHAVLAEPGRWWSWGKRYDPSVWPDAVIEEAWAVTW